MKNLSLKTKIGVLLICLVSLSVSADGGKTPCDSVITKVFGIVILERFYGDCSDRDLPDGNWDWWPNW
jgi:hypothetical protein